MANPFEFAERETTHLTIGESDEPQLQGLNYGLGAVRDPEFAYQVLDVVFDGSHAYNEFLGYLAVGFSLRQLFEHLYFARR